jgi:3-hydroxyacyl-CoA dehydrogenase/enoyl-CoA hydratase/3-hydroxybutyryl-CoA epimerase
MTTQMININIQNNIAVLGINVANQPMNVLNSESISALSEALEKVYTNPDVKGVILTSERPEFIVGADLKMILQNNGRAPEELFKLSMSLNTIFRKMETNGKPIVAAMNGTALGGGYEVCLACHHRVALNNPKSIIGLPEVTIGLLPGGGGTQRLPRMIGMEAAPLLLEGKKVSPKDALALGMVDQLADSPEEMLQKAVEWIETHPIAVQPWDEVDKKTGKIKARENFKVPGGNVLTPKGVQLMMGGTAMTLAKTQGNYPAPIEIMSCVYEGLLVNIDRGIVIEARHFVKVANSTVAKNLIRTTFFGLNEVNKGAGRPKMSHQRKSTVSEF